MWKEGEDEEFTKWKAMDFRVQGGGITADELRRMDREGELNKPTISEDKYVDIYGFEDKFTDQELDYFKEGFAYFDKRNDGTIRIQDLGLSLRSMGILVHQKELDILIKKYDPENTGYVDMNDYISSIAELSNKPDNEDEIIKAFSLFDKTSNGLINIHEFSHVLSRIGDPLSEEELGSIFEVLDVYEDGHLRMEDIIRLFNIPSPHNNAINEN